MVAIFVLVHGGGHGGWCYKPVAQRLRSRGHQVFAPTLSGLAERAHLLSADIDLDTHIDDICQLLFFEDLTDVILVGHSYGGMVITGAADRCPDRVGHRVYLDAAYPHDGESLNDRAAPLMKIAREEMGMDRDGVELAMCPSMAVVDMMGITDTEMRQWVLDRLRPHPWKCFIQPLDFQNEARMRAIPESHILCDYNKGRFDLEELKATAQGRLWSIDTGHDLMLTEPDLVAGYLEEIAAATP